MQRADLVEKRRFVGREWLLMTWMESELFDYTLSTKEHGSFGLWVEKKLVLSDEAKSTRITAPMPGLGREAKEALLAGQLPESAGLRLTLGDDETSLVIDAESFGVRAMKLQSALAAAASGEAVVGDLVDEMAGRTRGRPKKSKDADPAVRAAEEEAAFQERMSGARGIEGVLAALYRDFLEIRLGRRWGAVVVPTLQRWAEGEKVDADAYQRARAGKPATKTAAKSKR